EPARGHAGRARLDRPRQRRDRSLLRWQELPRPGLQRLHAEPCAVGFDVQALRLVAGLENGVRLTDSYPGSSPTTLNNEGTPWTVNNFGNTSYGPVSLLKATQSSINTAYAALNVQVGPD